MIITRDTDIVFMLGPVSVVFAADYKETGAPGLIVQFDDGSSPQVIEAPLAIEHVIQMKAFSMTAMVKKLDELMQENEELQHYKPKPEQGEAKIYKFPRLED